MREQEKIMQAEGYVTAADAARAIGANNMGSIHRAVQAKRLLGCRAGIHWYVSVASLLDMNKDAPPILDRIKALGVAPNPAHEKQIKGEAKEKSNGKRRAHSRKTG